MKKCYVYELVNLMGTVEYVGETYTPEKRLLKHTKDRCIKNTGNGKFFGRSDIFMNVVKEFNSKEEAFDYQCKLQREYGFKPDDEKHQFGKSSLSVVAISLETGNEIIFESITKCAKYIGCASNNVWKVLNPNLNNKSAKGYTFKLK